MIKKNIFTSKNIDLIMLICVIGYTFFKLANRAIGDVFLGGLFIGTIYVIIKQRKYFIKDKIFLLLVFSIAVQVISWITGHLISPYEVKKLSLTPLTSLCYFICVAYWLKGNPRYVLLTLLIFCCGTVYTYAIHSDNFFQEFAQGLSGIRIDFNITNANHTAALSGVVCVIASFLLVIAYKARKQNKLIHLYILLIFCILTLSILVTYMTLSRATWLALLLCIAFSFFYFIANTRRKLTTTIITLCLIAASLGATLSIDSVRNRISSEQITFSTLKKLTEENTTIRKIPDSSIGLRIKFWSSALPWIAQYPITGLGDRFAREFVLKKSPYLSNEVKKEYTHLHQGHLEVLTGYGILGLLVVWGIFFYVIKTAFSVNSPYKKYITWGSMTFMIYYFSINMSESFFFFKSGELIHNVVLGCIYTFYLTQNIKRYEEETA